MSLPLEILEGLSKEHFNWVMSLVLTHNKECCSGKECHNKNTSFYYDGSINVRFRCPNHTNPGWIKLSEKDIFTLKCL